MRPVRVESLAFTKRFDARAVVDAGAELASAAAQPRLHDLARRRPPGALRLRASRGRAALLHPRRGSTARRRHGSGPRPRWSRSGSAPRRPSRRGSGSASSAPGSPSGSSASSPRSRFDSPPPDARTASLPYRRFAAREPGPYVAALGGIVGPLQRHLRAHVRARRRSDRSGDRDLLLDRSQGHRDHPRDHHRARLGRGDPGGDRDRRPPLRPRRLRARVREGAWVGAREPAVVSSPADAARAARAGGVRDARQPPRRPRGAAVPAALRARASSRATTTPSSSRRPGSRSRGPDYTNAPGAIRLHPGGDRGPRRREPRRLREGGDRAAGEDPRAARGPS